MYRTLNTPSVVTGVRPSTPFTYTISPMKATFMRGVVLRIFTGDSTNDFNMVESFWLADVQTAKSYVKSYYLR